LSNVGQEEHTKMKTVRLGKTGLEVSRVGMGGIPIQRPPLDEAVRVIQRALDLGVNFIDTAYSYGAGMSEERIGKAIAGRREQVILATKGGWRDKATVMEHIERSRQRLKTDYIDLWQLHGVNSLEGYEGVLKPGGALEGAQEALKAGTIRHIGLSSHSPDVARAAIASGFLKRSNSHSTLSPESLRRCWCHWPGNTTSALSP
jgi:aryl-alcohol dehydrogenase-like predicted oxidoreductase